MFLLLQATRQLAPNTNCFLSRQQTEQLKLNDGLLSDLLLQNRQRGIHTYPKIKKKGIMTAAKQGSRRFVQLT